MAAASEEPHRTLDRRRFLKVTVLSALAVAFPATRSIASSAQPALPEKALSLCAGGMGYYPRPDFIHMDFGRVRSW
jgi:hypothetical protein